MGSIHSTCLSRAIKMVQSPPMAPEKHGVAGARMIVCHGPKLIACDWCKVGVKIMRCPSDAKVHASESESARLLAPMNKQADLAVSVFVSSLPFDHAV